MKKHLRDMELLTINFQQHQFRVQVDTDFEKKFWDDFTNGRWEKENLSYMLNNRRGKIFVDIGSWIGPVTLLMASEYKNVVAVDLDVVANRKLKTNLSLNGISNVDLHELGLSDKAGTLEINAENLGVSTTSIYQQSNGKTITAKLMKFQDFMKALPSKEDVGFIKIDCEGAEYKFLPGLYSYIEGRPITVMISYHPFVLSRPVYYFVKMYHWMRQLRFRRHYFTKDGSIITCEKYKPLFRLTDRFPMADVIEGS